MSQHEQRRKRLQSVVRRSDANSILVTGEANVTYLTGFTGDSSYLLLTPTEAIMLSDARYTTQLEEECSGVELQIRRPPTSMIELVEKVVKQAKPGKLAVEADSLTLAGFDALAEKLTKTEFTKTSGLVEQLREIKDKGEVAAIRRAVRLAEQAFAVVRASLRPEMTERQVAHQLEQEVRAFGGLGAAFETIVGVGDRAALPHYRPANRQIHESDFVLIDWGAREELYLSDLTRVLVTGRISPKLERIYGVVLKAQLAAIAKIKPGALMKDVDAAARTTIAKAGHDKHFGHGLGHGFGLEIHESPRLASNQQRPLKAGMVITIEPGIYLPNWGGVRIEDDVLVTRDGHEVLSSVPKKFAECVIS